MATDGALIYYDFGMMGQIDDSLRDGLQRFIFALVARDARGCVDAMQRLGVLLPSADAALPIEVELTPAADATVPIAVAFPPSRTIRSTGR